MASTTTSLSLLIQTLSVLNVARLDISLGPAPRGRVTSVFLSDRGGTRPSRPDRGPRGNDLGRLGRYTLNITRDIVRSLKALEIIIVELQRLEATGDLLDITAQGALVHSRFKSAAEMDAPSKFFFSSLLFGHALNKAGLPALFLGQSEALNGVSSNHLWRRHYCNSDKESVCVFRRVCQSYALTLVQLSSHSEDLRRNPTGETHTLQKMALRLKLMCVLFVGPLPHTYTEKNVHTLLKPYGTLRSVRLLYSTHKLHAVVEFQHLEGAELALQSLTNLQVEDAMIKLQRPVNDLTLDLDASLAELQNDIQNSHMIYVGRLSWRRRHQLLQAFSSFGPACDITPTKDSGKCQRHTRISAFYSYTLCQCTRSQCTRVSVLESVHYKFVRSDSACTALDSLVQMGNRKLNTCHALTPAHMHSWTHTNPVTMETTIESTGLEERTVREEAEPAGLNCAQVQDGGTQHAMRRLDRNVGKMCRALERHTLSIVILPGFIRDGVEYHGLCFIQVKQV
ncbi:hypothetical protein QTP70_032548 [Hemibagrus guttatus]|uniref:RRM domain-containing protein n=1 Tax=Hemibagrus guttatus TaxID=175788 RepID=A0AAE0ULZ7_9TELE|nr:hypothetical protein QTP70_032548 [Hemibagrus guttatus]